MAIRTIEKTIGNSVYSFNTMNTGKRVEFLARITKAFGASITAFFNSTDTAPDDVDTLEAIKAFSEAKPLTPEQEVLLAKKQEKDNVKMSDNITKAVELLIQNMDKENVPALIKDLTVRSEVVINGKPLTNYDTEIEDLGELFQLLFSIVQENFGSVFTLSGVTSR